MHVLTAVRLHHAALADADDTADDFAAYFIDSSAPAERIRRVC